MIRKTNVLFRDLLALVSVAGAVSSASAIDKSWAFPLTGNVSVAGQWTPFGVPLVTDDWIFNPRGTYTVTFDVAAPDASNTLSFRDNSTITVVNPSVTHVTNEVRVGSQAGPLSVTLTDGTIRAGTFALASIVANGEGTLIAENAATSLLVEDNGLVRIADNTGATATLSLRDGATLTDITNPPGFTVDSGRVLVGDGGTLEVDGGSILLDEWELDMSAGGTLELANGGLVEIEELLLGATSVVRGSGTLDWGIIEAEPTAMIENVGDLTLSTIGVDILSGTLRVNAGVIDYSEAIGVLSGILDPSTIVLNGGTIRVDGGAGSITNYSAVTGFGVIDATVRNESSITPTLGGITINGELEQTSSGASINGTRVILAPGSSFLGKGTVASGFVIQPGSSLTLTGNANFGAPALGVIGNVVLLADSNLAGFVGTFNTAAALPLPARMILNQGTMVVPAGMRIEPSGELRGPGLVQGSVSNGGLIATGGPILQSVGSLGLTPVSTTRFNMGMTGATGFGSYRVASPGTLSLAGTLEVALGPNFDYVTGDEFVLMDAPAGRAGTFIATTIINERFGALLDIVYTPTGVRLRVLAGGCDRIDFNGDGLFPEDADLVDFLAVLAGGACSTGSCGSIDFNNDGLFPDDTDLIAFLRVLAGGSCS